MVVGVTGVQGAVNDVHDPITQQQITLHHLRGIDEDGAVSLRRNGHCVVVVVSSLLGICLQHRSVDKVAAVADKSPGGVAVDDMGVQQVGEV